VICGEDIERAHKNRIELPQPRLAMPEDIPAKPSTGPAPKPTPDPESAPLIDLGPGPGINIAEEFGTAKRNLPPAKIVAIVLAAAAIFVGVFAFLERAKPQGGGSVDNIAVAEIPDQHAVMVAVNITLRNSGEKPLWIHDIKAKIATDSGELTDEAASAVDFDRYFQVTDGQLVARSGVDASGANAGVQELLGLVNATENYVYFAGTDGGAAADLFQGTRDDKGKLTNAGKAISNRFTCGGNYISGCGTQVGTTGRTNADQPAKLANGDPVFAVIAINTNTVITETKTDYGTLNPVPGDVKTAQEAGVGQVVRVILYHSMKDRLHRLKNLNGS